MTFETVLSGPGEDETETIIVGSGWLWIEGSDLEGRIEAELHITILFDE